MAEKQQQQSSEHSTGAVGPALRVADDAEEHEQDHHAIGEDGQRAYHSDIILFAVRL